MLRYLVLLLIPPTALAQTIAFDVTNPASYGHANDPNDHGAKCDGSTPDTLSFNNCLSHANSLGGGACIVPATVTHSCVIDTQINMDNFVGVALIGPPTTLPATTPTLNFTGSSGPLLSMRSTFQVSLKNLKLVYSNPNFFGQAFIDMSGVSPKQTTMDYIADCVISGTSANPNANPLINMDRIINTTIERSWFALAAVGIVGQANSGSYSNVIHIRDNFFVNVSVAHIWNFGQAWTIEGNTFEMGNATFHPDIYPVALDGNLQGCFGCMISGDWIGDTAPQFNSWLVQGHFQGTSFTGNHIEGPNSGSQANGILLGSNSVGVSITANHLQFLVNALGISNNAASDLFVYGNAGMTTSGQPVTGMVEGAPTNFYGDLFVQGTLSKTVGSFRIDHPLAPTLKYLQHSFVESPDMMNIYNGVVTLDSHGKAEVNLPAYFEALNQDFRYQLTPIGGYAPLYVAREIQGNSFLIAGGRPGLKVSWQVTGIRHDAYADTHRIVVEQDKPAAHERLDHGNYPPNKK